MKRVRVEVPGSLRVLAGVPCEVVVEIEGRVTQGAILDGLEALYPALRGTMRDQGTLLRRPFIRFFACGSDLSHEGMEAEVPEAVAEGREVFVVIGAVAGG